MKVNIDELRLHYQMKLGLSFKETLSGVSAVKPVLGDLYLALDSCGVRLSGRLQTLLKLNCDRCLRPYFQALSVEIDERFVEASREDQPRDRELKGDDFVETLPANGILDISDIVYQAVTLATPTYCLCGDQCPGPPSAGASGDTAEPEPEKTKGRPLDPRWENLKTLFSNEETG